MSDEEPENDEEEEQRELIDRQIRTHKALQHMERELQLPSSTVMPTLLKLIKAYDGKWEFIEADNYHVLVDTIFSMQESEDEQKAPGSSSGSSRKRKERKPPSMRGTSSRRGARNSKRAESDDSDEHEGAQALVRRGRGRGTMTRTSTRPTALMNTETSKRKALAVVPVDENEGCEPPWEPLLALPEPLQSVAPQCLSELPSAGGRGEFRRLPAGPWARHEMVPTTTTPAVSRETQTDALCLYDQADDHIPDNALICYEEFPPEIPKETMRPERSKETMLAIREALPQTENANGTTTPFMKEAMSQSENSKKAMPVMKEAMSQSENSKKAKSVMKETISQSENSKKAMPVMKGTLPPSESSKKAMTITVKKEKTPVFLSDSEVRRQLLNPFQQVSSEICGKCDKYKPLPPVRFDPSRVKVEGGNDSSGRGKESLSSVACFNPEPLQVVVPVPAPLPLPLSLPLPLPLPSPTSDLEPELRDTGPEPLLLTPPETMESSPEELTDEPRGTTEAVVCTETSAGVQQGLVSGSERAAMDIDCHTSLGMACEPVLVQTVEPGPDPLTIVENAVKSPSEIEVKESPRSLDKFETAAEEQVEPSGGPGCQNSTSEGALAALANYSSESEHSNVDMIPEQEEDQGPSTEEVTNTSSCYPNEGEVQGKVEAHDATHGILPLSNASSLAELREHSKDDTVIATAFEIPGVESRTVESFPEQSRDSWVFVEVRQSQALAFPALATQASSEILETAGTTEDVDTDMAPPKEDPSQFSDHQTSTESSKKRKRILIKLKDLEEEQSGMDADTASANPVLHAHPPEAVFQRHDQLDISRGKEKIPISLCRDANGTKHLPEGFFYMTASVVYQSAHVGISMARIGEDDRCSGCVGNCLDNRVPCECTRLTDGEFAYTVEGRLYPHFLKQEMERKKDMALLSYCQPGACPMERTNEEVCKGHVQRRFIKECWEKCGCDQTCGNRIVQRGLFHKLQVFWTECGKGWGIRTLEPLRAGTFVCEYVGEILTNAEMYQRNIDAQQRQGPQHHFSLQLDADWCSERYLKDEEALCLDGACFGNVARFINHRCFDANLIEIPVEIESPDHHYYHLAFFTSKDVRENEELTWDYGLDFNDKDHQIQAFECLCGSPFCRDKSEGKPGM